MIRYLSVVGLTGLFLFLNAQVPLETTPFWVSEIAAYTCDIVFGDIDGDGDLDMAVSSEVPEGHATYIYINSGSGLETYPSLMLPDTRSMGIAFGDVDNDGDLDLATGYTRFFGQYVRLYLNRGGTLDTIPAWTGITGAIWCGWGDVDGDGDLDLAAVDIFNDAAVYLNNNGILESTPSWRATDSYSWDWAGAWFDVDDDGDLDLAIGLDYRIYFNNNGTLETVASWHPDAPLVHSGVGLAAGDVNHDGLLDLAVGGGGSVEDEPNFLHFNSVSGLETSPSWISGDNSMTWRVAFGDVDGDGYLDLAAANYYGEVSVVYLNTEGTLETSPSWSSSIVDTSYGIAWVDVDNDGVINKTDTLTGNGTRKLFYLSHFPAHVFQGVTVDGSPVLLSDYCFDPVAGWVSQKNPPANGSEILLQYSYSVDLDLAVGSFSPKMYRNTTTGIEETPKTSFPVSLFKITPTVLGKGSEISFVLNKSGTVNLSLYDLLGREISRENMGELQTGRHTCTETKKLASGIYFLAVSVNGERQVEKFLICE
ncbi:MAG: FG-GAP-like repeat-containing protein [bacterium]